MGSTLFFVMRELRRLNVLPDTEEINASCFFVCEPVRRAAARFGLIDSALAGRYDFVSLQKTSRQIYEAFKGNAVLLPWFDIPLLHYAKTRREDLFL